jgi:hypothetical protein
LGYAQVLVLGVPLIVQLFDIFSNEFGIIPPRRYFCLSGKPGVVCDL